MSLSVPKNTVMSPTRDGTPVALAARGGVSSPGHDSSPAYSLQAEKRRLLASGSRFGAAARMLVAGLEAQSVFASAGTARLF